MPESIIGSVADSWTVTSLANICNEGGGGIQTGPFGSQLHASDYVTHGIPSVMPQNIGDNKIIETGIARISIEDAGRLSRYLLESGDIVYSRRGDVERRALVRENENGWLCGTGCLRVRPGKGINSRFLSYYLGHPGVREWIVRHAVGATMPNLNTKILGALPVAAPADKEQVAIGVALGALDDKIESNRSISETASNLADSQLILALVEIRDILLPLLRGDLDSTHAAGDWEVLTLHEACSRGGGDIQTGPFGSQLHASDYAVSGVPVVMPKDIGANIFVSDSVARISKNTAARLSRHRLQEGDVVYARRGDVERRALVRADNAGWLCGTGCLRVRPGRVVDKYFLAYYFGHPEVRNWVVRHAIGATMPNLNTAILGALPVVLPPASLRLTLANRLAALDEILVHAVRQNQILIELRDALLPKLMSGEIRVRDAEKIVEDVT